jgi:hypothetical protein
MAASLGTTWAFPYGRPFPVAVVGSSRARRNRAEGGIDGSSSGGATLLRGKDKKVDGNRREQTWRHRGAADWTAGSTRCFGPRPTGGPASPPERSATGRSVGALTSHPPAYREGLPENALRSGPSERNAFHGEPESKGLTTSCARPMRLPAGTPDGGLPSGRGHYPRAPILPSNGRALEVGRRGLTAVGDGKGCPDTVSVTFFAAGPPSTLMAARPPAPAAARCPLA